MTLLTKIVRRRPAELLLAAEALTLLAFFRVCLALIPVRRIIQSITHGPAGVAPVAELGETAGARISQTSRRVQWAVRAAARHSPVEFVCFPQTLAAYTMLRWRGVASTMVYGVSRSPEEGLIAHTWLEAAGGCVVGGEEASGFTAIDRWT
jgi:hypothetical protein